METPLDVANFIWEMKSAARNYPLVLAREVAPSEEKLGAEKMVDDDLVISAYRHTSARIYHLAPGSEADELLTRISPHVGGSKVFLSPMPSTAAQQTSKWRTSLGNLGRAILHVISIGI